ncbi:MAG: hypothetical protein E6593_00100 [Clostridium sp.]|nr:hypothetical protein [Clostridium sp.]
MIFALFTFCSLLSASYARLAGEVYRLERKYNDLRSRTNDSFEATRRRRML